MWKVLVILFVYVTVFYFLPHGVFYFAYCKINVFIINKYMRLILVLIRLVELNH